MTSPRRSHPTVVTVLAVIGGGAVIALMVSIVLDTVLRATRGQGIVGALDIVQYWWVPAIAYLGLGAAHRDGEHITAPVIYERLPHPIQRHWDILGNLLTAVVLALVCWYGWQGAERQMAIGERASGSSLVIWPARFLVPIGAAWLLVEALRAAGRAIQQRSATDTGPLEPNTDPTSVGSAQQAAMHGDGVPRERE